MGVVEKPVSPSGSGGRTQPLTQIDAAAASGRPTTSDTLTSARWGPRKRTLPGSLSQPTLETNLVPKMK